MMNGGIIYMELLDMKSWYNNYEGIPYKHLGDDPKKALDCFNLIKYIYLKELNIRIPYNTSNFCDCPFEDWYNGLSGAPFSNFNDPQYGWKKNFSKPNIYNAILISLGSTNCANHCAIYVGNNRILHTMQDIGHSRIAVYGKYYEQYTEGIYEWVDMPN